MTPKEKAKEIIDKFIFIDNGEKFQIISMENEILAKQYAMIAVDYLINTEFQTVNKLLETIKQNKIKLILSLNQDYWQEVKKEIELM